MNKLIILLFLIINAGQSHATCQYRIGDQLYVWSLNGLKLRSGASTNSMQVGIINKGEKVTVISKTDLHHDEIIKIEGDPEKPDLHYEPFLFKGKWVQVVTSKSDTGYIIDNYLLPVVYTHSKHPDNIALHVKILQSKTLFKKDCDGEELCLKINYSMDKNINCLMQQGGVWTSVLYTFPKLTLNEVLLIFSAAYQNFKGLYISSFEEGKLELSDESNCRYIFKIYKDKITLEELCTC